MTTKPEVKPIRQVPTWNRDAKFEITGEELEILQRFFNIFTQPVQVLQNLFSRNIQGGLIEIVYQDEEGNPVSKEEVQDQLKRLSEYYASLKETDSEEVPKSTEPKNPLKAV